MRDFKIDFVDVLVLALVAALGLGVWYLERNRSTVPANPAPVSPVKPQPTPPRCPSPGPCPRGESGVFGASLGGNVAPDGTPVQIDLPPDRHVRNTGGMGPRGPGSGAGLCVFTSIQHAADWQGVEILQDFQKWMMSKPGGGHPSKVAKMIRQKCQEAGRPEPAYVQITGGDLAMLKLACKTGRMPGVTYCVSPAGRYGGRRISHMVSLMHADDRGNWSIMDNNYPKSFEWMTEQEFRRTYTGGGGGWAVILLDPGPPPVPRN